MRPLLLVALLFGGCGVDSTRGMWESDWHGRSSPSASTADRIGCGVAAGGEIVIKVVASPVTIAFDVVTDEGFRSLVSGVGEIVAIPLWIFGPALVGSH